MEELQEEAHRRSMYEISKEIRESKSSVSRLMYIAKLNTEDRQHKIDLNDDMYKWMKGMDAVITGLLILTGNYVIHIVESDTETLISLVTHTEKLAKQEPSPFTALTIPLFTEENPKRIFKFWSFTTIQPDSTGEEDPEAFLPEDITWSFYSLLLEIGAKLGERYSGDQNNPSGVQAALKSITSSKKLVPKQEILGLLVTDKFPSFEDFYEIYVRPIDIVFDSELCWPCPPELNF